MYQIKCDVCGKFCIPADSQTHFGCSNPADPAPYDPEYFCERCTKKLKDEWSRDFAIGSTYGCWQKSKAEIEAAKAAGLIWIGNTNTMRDKDCRIVMNRYVSPEFLETLSK